MDDTIYVLHEMDFDRAQGNVVWPNPRRHGFVFLPATAPPRCSLSLHPPLPWFPGTHHEGVAQQSLGPIQFQQPVALGLPEPQQHEVLKAALFRKICRCLPQMCRPVRKKSGRSSLALAVWNSSRSRNCHSSSSSRRTTVWRSEFRS